MSTINYDESVTDLLAVSIERGAAMVGVTSRHLRKQLDTDGGPIRTVRMGNRVLIPIDELRNYLKPPADSQADRRGSETRDQATRAAAGEVKSGLKSGFKAS